jgi:hypothetical protein
MVYVVNIHLCLCCAPQSLLHSCLGCEASTIAALKVAVQLCSLLAYASDVCLCNSRALKGNKSNEGLKTLAKCSIKPGQLPLLQLVSRCVCSHEQKYHNLHVVVYIYVTQSCNITHTIHFKQCTYVQLCALVFVYCSIDDCVFIGDLQAMLSAA